MNSPESFEKYPENCEILVSADAKDLVTYSSLSSDPNDGNSI
jgi:hypothetical protein